MTEITIPTIGKGNNVVAVSSNDIVFCSFVSKINYLLNNFSQILLSSSSLSSFKNGMEQLNKNVIA